MIRKLIREDRETYLRLAEEFYASPAVLRPAPRRHLEAAFDEMMRSGAYLCGYLLHEGGRAAGYALLSRTFSQEAGGPALWLEELYVRPAFRGRGLGSSFLDHMEQTRPCDVRRFRLEVEPDNLAALELYRRLGYSALPYVQLVKEFADKTE